MAPATNVMESRHIIGLVGYYRKFFSLFSNTIRPLNELTRKNATFKFTGQYLRCLEYMKQTIKTSHIVIYQDQNKQYYLYIDSSKHSWNGILIQYSEQKKYDRTKIKIPYPIAYQSETYQGSQENWSTLTKEAYAIYMSF